MTPAALTGFLSLVVSVAMAQIKESPLDMYPYEAGLSAGRNQYFGDLYFRSNYLSTGFNYSLHGYVRRWVTPYLRLRGNLYAGGLSANDRDNPTGRWDYRRISFSSPMVEVSAMLEFYPLKQQSFRPGGTFLSKLSPYGFAGVGSVYTNPVVSVRPEAPLPPAPDELEYDATHKTKLALVMPIGIGVNYPVNPKLSLGIDVGYRFTPSDYLDGFHASSYGYSEHPDTYIIANVMVGFRVGRTTTPTIDADADGVIDLDDSCPDEFGDPATCGCPDDDKDGVPNACDCCPYEKGERMYHGCTKEHQIEYEHVHQTNRLRYCPLCPPDLPNASRLKKTYRHRPIRLISFKLH